MNFRKLSQSVIAATGILISTVPAYAGPFDAAPSGIFRNPGLSVAPGAAGLATPSATPGAGETPASESEQLGNGEIQGLGNHDSWVDTGVLAEDPRALCSDVGLGNNTYASNTQTNSSSSESIRNSSSRSHRDGGGGGVSVLGIVGVNGEGSSQGSQSNSNSSDTRTTGSEARSLETSTVVVGRNCDAFVEAAAARDMNYEDNVTERYRIRVGRRGEQVDNLLEN